MTPIRVRGKKRKISGKTQMAKQVSAPKSLSRPIMFKPTRKLSQLERLPAELLQEIFLQSLNLNLPRASPVLGSILSSSHIKKLLVFLAFSSDDGYCLEHSAELLSILHTKQEIGNLQSAILRLKWMDLTFLNQCIRSFIVKTLLHRFLEFNLGWKKPGQKPTEATVTEFVTEVYGRNCSGFEGEGLLDLYHFTWHMGDQNKVILSLGLRDGLVELQFGSKPDLKSRGYDQYRWRLLFCLEGCRIPDKLLHGPWTNSKCDFLEIVTRSGASVDWVSSTGGEVADLGLKDAVLEHNHRAVDLLVGLPPQARFRSYHLDYGAHPRKRRRQSMAGDAETQACPLESTRRSVGVVPRVEHLRIAVTQEGFHKGIVERLLTRDKSWEKSAIDLEDEEINEWALRKKIAGDEDGSWLYQRLSDLKEMAFLSELDSTWECCVGPLSDDVAATAEDGRLIMENSNESHDEPAMTIANDDNSVQ